MSIHRGGVENKKGVLKRHYYRWCYKAFENSVLVHMYCRGPRGWYLASDDLAHVQSHVELFRRVTGGGQREGVAVG